MTVGNGVSSLTEFMVSLGLVAALGLPGVRVQRKPTVAVFTTGDELRPPGVVLAPGQIYDSNRALLQTLLAAESPIIQYMASPWGWVVSDDIAGLVALPGGDFVPGQVYRTS